MEGVGLVPRGGQGYYYRGGAVTKLGCEYYGGGMGPVLWGVASAMQGGWRVLKGVWLVTTTKGLTSKLRSCHPCSSAEDTPLPCRL